MDVRHALACSSSVLTLSALFHGRPASEQPSVIKVTYLDRHRQRLGAVRALHRASHVLHSEEQVRHLVSVQVHYARHDASGQNQHICGSGSSRIGVRVGVVRTSREERLEVDDREGQSGGVEHCDQAHVCPTSSEAM